MTAVADAPPARSYVQQMEALNRANENRMKRAALKRDLKAGRALVTDILASPPKWAEKMKVYALLMAAPKYGRVKTDRVLCLCRISPSKTVGGLSERQRAELICLVRSGPRTPTSQRGSCSGTAPDSQHMRALADANRTRATRSALRHRIATGVLTVSDVLDEMPVAARTMTMFDLLSAQYRWGRQRTIRVLNRLQVPEAKLVGSLTMRQRRMVAYEVDDAS